MNIQFILNTLESLIIQSNVGSVTSSISGFSIDTRTIESGQVFVAMQGEQSHGNVYAANALAKGAVCIITDMSLPNDQPHILVKDALHAITVLADAYRQTLSATVIAVTGSVGKTTVKEGLKHILSGLGHITHASIKSYNNHIGVPLTILNCPLNAEFLILEMGMNSPGEIKARTLLGKPHVAVVTEVGPGHIEFFDTVKDIALEKVSICDGLQSDGVAILPFDNDFYSQMLEYAQEKLNVPKVVSFGCNVGAEICNVAWEICNEGHAKVRTKIGEVAVEYTLPSTNKSYLHNSLVMLAVLSVLKVNMHNAVTLLESLPIVEGRGQVHALTYQGINFTLIDDAYNANPISMTAALESLEHYIGGRKIAVLGDMRELGQFTQKYHTEIGQLCKKLKIEKVITCGDASIDIFNELDKAQQLMHCKTYEDVLECLLPELQPNDIILFKASNGVKLHQVVRQLKGLG